MDLIKQMGLGFVLEFTDKTSREVRAAAKEINGLKGQVEGLSGSFDKQFDNIERQMKRGKELMGIGVKGMAAGAALITPVIIATNAAMKDQDTWYNVVTQEIYKMNVAKDKAVESMRREQDMVKKLTHEDIPIPGDAAEPAWIRLRGLMNDTAAASAAFTESMKIAAVTASDPTATVEAFNIINSLTKAEFAHMDAQQRAIRIAEMLTRANRQYGAGVADIADGLKMVMNEANLAKPRISELFAMITPLTASGMNARMAGSAVGGFFTEIAKFDADVKAKQRELSKPVLSLTDLRQRQEARKALSPELQQLMKVPRTDSTGGYRSPLDIIADWEKAFGVSVERAAQVEADIKSGKLTERDRMKALGLTGPQQQALIQTGVNGIGHWFGKAQDLKQTADLFETEGKLDEALAALSDVASTDTKKMHSAFEDLTEELGDKLLPTVQDLSKKLRDLADAASNFVAAHPTISENSMKALAVSGLTLTGLGGAAVGVGSLYWGAKKLQKWQKELSKKAAKEVATSVDDVAEAAAKQAGSQIDDLGKQVAKQTVAHADEFFSEFAPAVETVAKKSGWFKRAGGGFLKGGAKAGLGALALLPVLPWDAEAGGLASLSETHHGFGMNVMPNLIETGMWNPVRDQRIATVSKVSDRNSDMMAKLLELFDSSSIESTRRGQVPDGKVIYQSNFFEFREATEDSAIAAATIIEDKARDASNRSMSKKF